MLDGYPVYAIENLRSPILTHVVVSEGIEVIGDSAFKAYFDYEKGYIRTLVSVSLPQSLKIISDDGFWGQENLQEITLGSVVEIGQSAFGSCTMRHEHRDRQNCDCTRKLLPDRHNSRPGD